MITLDEIKFNGGMGFGDLIIFGIDPCRSIAHSIYRETGEYADKYPGEIHGLSMAVVEYLDNMKKCINRLLDEMDEDEAGDTPVRREA